VPPEKHVLMKLEYVAEVTEPLQLACVHIISPNPPPLTAVVEHDLTLDTIKKPWHVVGVVVDVHMVQFMSEQEYSTTLPPEHPSLL